MEVTHKHISIFECSDEEFRLRVVEKINTLLTKVTGQAQEIEELKNQIDDLETKINLSGL